MSEQAKLEARIAALPKEVRELYLRRLTKKFMGAPSMTRNRRRHSVSVGGPAPMTRATPRRIGRVTIAPGITLTTVPGSLYSTMCKALADLGHLDRQDALFAAFLRSPTPASAKKLIDQIGVARTDMETRVRADQEFQDHCGRRTDEYMRKAAAGNRKYQRILRNPSICDKRGNWIGDIEEAISILACARALAQVQRGKNQRILNRAGLMFDTMLIAGTQLCFLYKQQWHRAFKKALALHP